MIKLIAFDLDGTLTQHKTRLGAENKTISTTRFQSTVRKRDILTVRSFLWVTITVGAEMTSLFIFRISASFALTIIPVLKNI